MLSSTLFFFFLILLPPPRSPLFPYTTLFRSGLAVLVLLVLNQMGLLQLTGPGAGLGQLTNRLPFFVSCPRDRKSTRLNSSHVEISYAVFCLKKKKKKN